MKNYAKSLVEVEQILKHLPQPYLAKIPKDILNYIKENKDKNYKWEYDEKKKLKNQNINKETIAILSYLNIKYLLNNEQVEYMKKIHLLNERNNKK